MKPENRPTKTLITPADAARLVGVSAHIVRTAVRKGQLPATQIGNRTYLNRNHVLSLFNLQPPQAA